jgi:signal transduction histidine kinase
MVFSTYLHKLMLVEGISHNSLAYLLAAVYLLCGLWVFSLRRQHQTARLFAALTLAAAAAVVSYSYVGNTEAYLAVSLSLAGGALAGLAGTFPQELPAVKRRAILAWIGFVPALLLSALVLFSTSTQNSFTPAVQVSYMFFGAAGLAFLGAAVSSAAASPVPIVREQGRWIIILAAVAYGPLLAWAPAGPAAGVFLLLPSVIFPLGFAYIFLRSRVSLSDYAVRRSISYFFLFIFTTAGYALLVTGGSLLFGSTLSTSSPYLIGTVVFILAVIFSPLRARLEKAVDSLFINHQVRYRDILDLLGKDLNKAIELTEIYTLIHHSIQENLNPAQFHLFIQDPVSNQYFAAPAAGEQITTDLHFPETSPLVQTLKRRRSALILGDSRSIPAALQTEKSRMALLGAHLYLPLARQERLIGWLALGPRQTGENYHDLDLRFLESLSEQAALTIERAHVVANLEQRMHEMNVLTRVSQGVNITLAFDDILELIYAQTYQVIPTQDFRITLKDPYLDYLYHVFFLEKDERLNQNENTPLPPGFGLEMEVVHSRRPLTTDDYERECRVRGLQVAAQGLFSWMGVPLNAGAETIGLISLGSSNPAITYTTQQLSLMEAIADQTAGAIVKGRLLQESQQRARQLTFLNEVARSLTSTLELDLLLNQILQNAVKILNCEAGNLLLSDPQSDELVYEVVVGPVAGDLVKTRLPAGAGLVGRAVTTRMPVVANDVRNTQGRFEGPDQQAGFVTKNLLVVPMLIKDKVIGVIEVNNRKDGRPFTPDDQELLTAFTSQAAIAIENARLYTLTDQALAARVEELSVMQRIDRELNDSLEIERAMRITLSWAVRLSGADAGLVGTVEEDGIHIMASTGYSDELATYENSPLPVNISVIHEAVQHGLTRSARVDGDASGSLLLSARSHTALPIRREDNVIGVLFLESLREENQPEETLEFLSRLVDHAAIAIANARLYSAVEAANQAKSKFVSFVAHELKNPMASIKGYTELVSKGMAGPVNEMQSSFLATVVSNVDRMNTIVSDLNDLTKIEVGSLRLNFQATQLKDNLEDVIHSLRRQIDEKNISVQTLLPPALPAVWADPNRLSQILTNLVSNAVKYTPPDGKVLVGAEICPDQVGDQRTASAGEVAHVWITDTGIGIAPEDQEKIFQQYFRTSISKEFAAGTGLGLHITRTLVEMQGGRIWFDSELKKGSTFHFTIPLVEAS